MSKELVDTGSTFLNGKTVLIVDDDLTPITVTRKALEKNGSTVIAAKDAQEAILVLQRSIQEKQTIDMVLSDRNMGGGNKDGEYLISELARNPEYQGIIRVGVSGDDVNKISGDNAALLFMKNGAQAFINKKKVIPIINSDFRDIIPYIESAEFIAIGGDGKKFSANDMQEIFLQNSELTALEDNDSDRAFFDEKLPAIINTISNVGISLPSSRPQFCLLPLMPDMPAPEVGNLVAPVAQGEFATRYNIPQKRQSSAIEREAQSFVKKVLGTALDELDKLPNIPESSQISLAKREAKLFVEQVLGASTTKELGEKDSENIKRNQR